MIQPKMAALPAALFFFFSSFAFAGTFDNPTNLKVLPENISPDELGQTMRGFAMGTGNRCSACHVGEVEADLSTYDFSLSYARK